MATNFRLGLTPDEVEKEESKRLQELEKQAQERKHKQEVRLQQLYSKKKRNKIIVLVTFILIITTLLFFNIYNTFFNKPMEETEMIGMIKDYSTKFPADGLDGYIRDNFEEMFKNLTSVKDNTIESINPDLNSINIDNVVNVNSQFARVYFSIDIHTKHKDTKTEEDGVVPGEEKTDRLNFFLPVQWTFEEKDGKKTVAGYRPAGALSMYNLVSKNSIEPVETPVLQFTSEKADDATAQAAKIKLDKTLSDLYEGKDTSQDFLTYYDFDGHEGKYQGINNFELYQEPNKMGYNGIVTYTVLMPSGYSYVNTKYVRLDNNGSTWIMKGML